MAAVEEVLDPSRVKWYEPDLDLEAHSVRPPTRGDLSFAEKVARLAARFGRKAQTINDSLLDQNRASWVNSLLRAAGVSASERERLGEFSEVDWGEEDRLPESAFP